MAVNVRSGGHARSTLELRVVDRNLTRQVTSTLINLRSPTVHTLQAGSSAVEPDQLASRDVLAYGLPLQPV